jgi:hypothetical protein
VQLRGSHLELGKSDLLLPAYGTRTIAVQVPDTSIYSLGQAGVQVVKATIEVDSSNPDCLAGLGAPPDGTWCSANAAATVVVGPTKPAFAVDPVAFQFPDIRPGETAALDVTVTNISTESRRPKVTFADRSYDYQLQAWDADPKVFGIHEACNGLLLPPGGSCLVTFEYHPVEPGAVINFTLLNIDGIGYQIGMIASTTEGVAAGG